MGPPTKVLSPLPPVAPPSLPMQLYPHHETHLADLLTPVAIYSRLREVYPETVLLESNDYRSAQNSFSYIGVQPMAKIVVQSGEVTQQLPGQAARSEPLDDYQAVPAILRDFVGQFRPTGTLPGGLINGFFGHTAFEAVQYCDTLEFDAAKRKFDLPDLHYRLYRYVIAIDHFREQLYLLENCLEGETPNLEPLRTLIFNGQYAPRSFAVTGEERSNLTDEAFRELVRTGKHHCQVGDVFQIVFSRQFQQDFEGDDFQVYRVLRSINPSPYLYYFDYTDYRIFGSSPEAQMVIRGQTARVNPIAGTYRRSGDDAEDARRAQALLNDPKETAEHIMLVDLARNDLGRHSTQVRVRQLKEVQYFSHVIHLVSAVEGELDESTNPVQVFGDTFPAGTLSGAPKYRALQLIDRYENQNRAFYGGAIGYIGFDGSMNQAIVIRSFLSYQNTLHYQAGAGIVAASDPESELQEVNNKLGALTKALRRVGAVTSTTRSGAASSPPVRRTK